MLSLNFGGMHQQAKNFSNHHKLEEAKNQFALEPLEEE